jgi:rhodanese-related sulfurtransferase
MFNKIWRSSILLLALISIGSWVLLTQTNIGNNQGEGEVLGVNSLDLAENETNPRLLSARDARQLMSQFETSGNPLNILDVRTDEEFQTGHIAGAVNLDYFNIDFEAILDTLDTSQTYLIYSESTTRGSETYVIMREKGFENVYHLVGGIRSWQAEGYDIIIND